MRGFGELLQRGSPLILPEGRGEEEKEDEEEGEIEDEEKQ